MDGEARFGTGQGVFGTQEAQVKDSQRQVRGVGKKQESEKTIRLKAIAESGVVADDRHFFIYLQQMMASTRATGSILFRRKEYVYENGEYRGCFKSDMVPPDFDEIEKQKSGDMNVENK